MKSRRWIGGWCLTAASLAAAGVFSGYAQLGGPQSGRPLEFSRPKSPDFTNTIGRLTAPKEDLENLDSTLFNRERSVAPRGSMDVVLPPMRTVNPVQTRRVLELIERRRDWMFNSPETLANKLSPDPQKSSSDAPENGQELSAVERYYMDLARQQNPGASDKQNGSTSGSLEEDNSLPEELKARTRELREALLGHDLAQEVSIGDNPLYNPLQGRSSGPASFGPPAAPSALELEARKTRMDEFREMTGVPSVTISPIDMFKALGTPDDPFGSRPKVVDVSIPSIAPPTLQQTKPAQVGELPSFASIPEVSRGLLLPTAPSNQKLEAPPARTAPPVPTFTAPKRMF